MTDTYKVIQADRDAARNFWDSGKLWTREDLAQAFAKHREDTEALIVGWLRDESARIQNLMTDDIGMSDMRIGVQLKIDRIADAIARGEHHTNNTPGD